MTRRVEQLDLLRFVAAVCVVGYHLLTATEAMRSVTRFGWIGVPLFFMISGFVIAWTAQNRSAYGFIAARISRLYPSFWVAVLLTSVVLGGVPWQTLLANLTMIPKPLGAPRIDDVYWTLEAEILFYGFILALIVTGQIHRLGLWLGAWLAVCAVGVVVPLPDVVTLKGFAPFFVSGGFFFLLRSEGATLPRSLGLIASTFLCVLAIAHHEPNFMRAVTPATHIVSVGFVIAAHAAFLAIALKRWTLPESPVWYWLGSLTYPLYLVHNEIGKRILETLPFGYWANISITLVCVFAISAVMAVIIEQRACKILHRLMRPAARLP